MRLSPTTPLLTKQIPFLGQNQNSNASVNIQKKLFYYPERISLPFQKIQEQLEKLAESIDSITQEKIEKMTQDICNDFASCFEDLESLKNGMLTFLLNDKTKEYKIHFAVEQSKQDALLDEETDSFVFLSAEESFHYEDKTHLFSDIFKRHRASLNPSDVFESLQSNGTIAVPEERSLVIARAELKFAEISEFEIFKMAKKNLSQRFQIEFNEQTYSDLSDLVESSYFK